MSEHEITLVLNGEQVRLRVEARRTLADVLRETLGLTGTRLGCEQGSCGACTVLMDGLPVRSCLLFAVQCEHRAIATIESLGGAHPLQRAMHEQHALQCGFCTPGFVMAIAGGLEEARAAGRLLDEEDLAVLVASGLCRCTGYQPILAAARQAATELGVLAERSRVGDQP